MSPAVVANDATKAGAVYYAKPSKSCLQSLGVSGLSCLTASSRFQGRLETVTARSVSGLRDEVDWNWGLSVKVLVSNVPRFNLSGLDWRVEFPSESRWSISRYWHHLDGGERFREVPLPQASLELVERERDRNGIYMPWASMLKFTSYADNVDVWVG